MIEKILNVRSFADLSKSKVGPNTPVAVSIYSVLIYVHNSKNNMIHIVLITPHKISTSLQMRITKT